MKVVKNLFEKKNIGQLILLILFLIYLTMGYSMPLWLANFVNSKSGLIVVIVITIILVIYSNPILGLVSVFVAYELTKRAMNYYNTSYQQGLKSLAQYNPKEKAVRSPFTLDNQWIPFTLEQEIVEKMAKPASCKDGDATTPATYSPIVERTYDAEVLNATSS
jgi:hypothetical protein